MTEHDDRAVPARHEKARIEHKYPLRREELATRYADEMIDLPNETESLGSVFDRLVDRRYESPAAAREAVLNELTGAEWDLREFNGERPIEELAADVHATRAIEVGTGESESRDRGATDRETGKEGT